MPTELPLAPEALATRAYEQRLSRLLMAYLSTGLVYLLGPGSFLGLWNLWAISHQRAALAVSPAWLQAHGHAEVYGWVGSFILGIGFHSLTRVRGARTPLGWAWTSWALWTTGVGLRWWAGVAAWHWRALLPASALLELAAFLIFQLAVMHAHHYDRRGGEPRAPGTRLPGWILLVFTGAFGFLLTLLLNLGGDVYLAYGAAAPAYPARFDERLVGLMAWGFLAPFVFGFSARWLPIFAGLRPVSDRLPRMLAAAIALGVVSTLAGWFTAAAACWLLAALLAAWGLHLFQPALQPAKTQGIHASFPLFLRVAYGWLVVSAALGMLAAVLPTVPGPGGASRHALTVGFIAGMVLTIGPRILPAFSGMRTLYSPRLMLAALALLHLGCALRVSGETLAYSGWWPWAWHWLPLSATLEVAAFTLFAYNLARTLLQPPAHLMEPHRPR